MNRKWLVKRGMKNHAGRKNNPQAETWGIAERREESVKSLRSGRRGYVTGGVSRFRPKGTADLHVSPSDDWLIDWLIDVCVCVCVCIKLMCILCICVGGLIITIKLPNFFPIYFLMIYIWVSISLHLQQHSLSFFYLQCLISKKGCHWSFHLTANKYPEFPLWLSRLQTWPVSEDAGKSLASLSGHEL